MRKLVFIFLFFIQLTGFSQADSIAYSREYEFREGIFLNVEQFRKNEPVPKSAIISSYPKTQVDFMKQVTDQRYISYKAADGSEQKVETLSLWGYCQNRSLFINFNNELNRVNQIGTLCHFTSIVNTPISYQDPMNTYGINTTDEMRQFVFDTQSNKVLDFNVKNMELLLQNDPGLYTEFMKLKKRKKADAIFIFLRRYNENHPLYLPVK
ncbi:MAG: hypothetical protein JWO44_2082 [Bacteroidetes bacterium]|nr:hypothetical protein [Bacteroidota bacterium]